jgi:RNA polymerase sigma-70 factor (ECF subfamily)
MNLASMQTVPAAAPRLGSRPPHLTLVTTGPAQDAELVAQALAGGAGRLEAEQQIYRKYRQAVHRLVSSFSDLDADEVEDVVQESFVRAFRSLRTLKEPERLSSWVFTIARNRARSHLTARSTYRRASEEATQAQELGQTAAPAPSDEWEREAALRTVREVIAALREGPEKETVRLFYLEGRLSAREIAQQMGVGKSAITMRLERFRAKVKAQLVARCAG